MLERTRTNTYASASRCSPGLGSRLHALPSQLGRSLRPVCAATHARTLRNRVAASNVESPHERPVAAKDEQDASRSPPENGVEEAPAPAPLAPLHDGARPAAPLELLASSHDVEVVSDDDDDGNGLQLLGGWLPTLAAVGGVALLVGGGYLFRGQIRTFLDFFIGIVDDWGPLGFLAYAVVYTGLEILAVPAIPLTMTAGAIFGPVTGTAIVSVSATVAATIAFLIARYAARDKIQVIAARNKRWSAIDRAIGRDGLKFVLLLRLSPLLPLALSNYLYGLTSVDLASYVAGSWLGMLPGTLLYVAAGWAGRAVLDEGGLDAEAGALGVQPWQVGLGVAVSLLVIGYVGRLAKDAIDEVEAEEALPPQPPPEE